MAEASLVKQLQKLAPKLRDGHSNIAEMRQATKALAHLAKALHQKPAVRREMGAGPLPGILAELLGAQPDTGKAADGEAYFELVGQDVFAADGLVEGDNEVNANKLFGAMFPQNAMVFLLNADALSKELWRQYLVGPWAPIVSILLKLTLFDGVPRDQLCIPKVVETLPMLAYRAYTPGQWGKTDADMSRATLAEYILHTVVNVSNKPEFNLGLDVVKTLLPSFKLWTGSNTSTPPAGLDTFSEKEAHTALGHEFNLLYHAASILHNFTKAGRVDPAILKDEETIGALVAFLEDPAVPSWVDQSKHSVETKEGLASILSSTRDMVTNFLMVLMSNPSAEVPSWLRNKVTAWLDDPRMLDVGLAALANGARDDTKSHALLAPPSDLPKRLVNLLKSSPTATVQHALVGLIRNLTVNPANRPLLGEGVVDGVLSLDPFQPARDPLDRLQLDAMIALSNLSTDPALAGRIMASESTISSLIALIQRTPLGAIKGLGATSLAQIISYLPSTGAEMAWTNAASTQILMTLGQLVVAASDPQTLGPAIAALLHIAQHSPEDAKRVATALRMNFGGKPVIRVVSGILAPPPIDPPPSSPEVEARTIELVKAVGNEGITEAVQNAVAENKKAGSKVAAGVETL
ncbi:hypothetical protein CspeluHIS016_0106130 [Cutaneotrichosporon spelunceum]|uniref:ARM repeat-containing protein n=1 Tax=Cutaneotrichosporon spelunceum TaxID=1672016 RepID=A0AAD3TP89_9TREE|nr:hypothetical protein CspeluHIS016_0106130 [Cutaneotrichosporon spelunceum]